MQVRIIHVGAAVAALVLALTVTRTDAWAASDKESCSTTSTDVNNVNADTTEALCNAAAGPPNRAKAQALDTGFAGSTAENMGTATAHAKGAGSDAEAIGNDGEATATAIGTDGFADVSAEGGGKGTATGKTGGEADVEVNGGTATAIASGVGTDAGALAEAPGAKAKATGKDTGAGGEVGALADAEAACQATANADGAGSFAQVDCLKDGSTVSADATKGSIATGSDEAASVCTAKNGGIARVKSPFDGGCHE